MTIPTNITCPKCGLILHYDPKDRLVSCLCGLRFYRNTVRASDARGNQSHRCAICKDPNKGIHAVGICKTCHNLLSYRQKAHGDKTMEKLKAGYAKRNRWLTLEQKREIAESQENRRELALKFKIHPSTVDKMRRKNRREYVHLQV